VAVVATVFFASLRKRVRQGKLDSAGLKSSAYIGGSAGPDTCGEGADGGEAEAFVELDGGAIFGGYGES
jgi:hypothetical protein